MSHFSPDIQAFILMIFLVRITVTSLRLSTFFSDALSFHSLLSSAPGVAPPDLKLTERGVPDLAGVRHTTLAGDGLHFDQLHTIGNCYALLLKHSYSPDIAGYCCNFRQFAGAISALPATVLEHWRLLRGR